MDVKGVTRLESENKFPRYILDLLKTVKSWLRHHGLMLRRRIKVSNPNATPISKTCRFHQRRSLAEFFKELLYFQREHQLNKKGGR